VDYVLKCIQPSHDRSEMKEIPDEGQRYRTPMAFAFSALGFKVED